MESHSQPPLEESVPSLATLSKSQLRESEENEVRVAGTPVNPQHYKTASARLHEPRPEPKKLSEMLLYLSLEKHKSCAWMAEECKKLVPFAQKLEAEKFTMGLQGMLVGAICGLALAFYLRLL